MKRPKLKDIKEQAEDVRDRALEKAKDAGHVVSDKAKDAGHAVSDKAVDVRDGFQEWRHGPISLEVFEADDHQLPEVLYVVDKDERFDNPLFASAIGFKEDVKGLSAMRVLTKNAGEPLGLRMEPIANEGAYMQDPFRPRRYIAVNDFPEYMRQARVDELTEIAQKLGAKHIKVTLCEEKKVYTKTNQTVKAKADAKEKKVQEGKGKAEAEKSASEKEYINSQILLEANFPGGEPEKPTLEFFRNPKMESLIRMRMEPPDKRLKGPFSLEMKYTTSADMTQKKAASIDAALKKWNLAGGAGVNATIKEDVQQSNRLVLICQIIFPD